ncbi:FAD/NAD-P-binding domain-containing protein [Cyathus striatus]|nr:FAD/NAD-P-binding domain-containing protein [Cyathus striatus]
MASTPDEIATTWLAVFGDALKAKDKDAVAACFLEDGWLRDLLAFTWDNRISHGRERVAQFLDGPLKTTHLSSFELEEKPGLLPEFTRVTPFQEGVASGFRFETDITFCRGYFRLLKEKNTGEWKALAVLTMADNIKGHEERDHEEWDRHGSDHSIGWPERLATRCEAAEHNPYVLIVGGGQCGLNVAARLKQMNITALIVEKNDRIGDSWRQRYPSLTLHTPRIHDIMLYQTYPSNWPVYPPRDKVADWLEQYAITQDLIYWTKSTVLPQPTYDPETRKWSVSINRNGALVHLNASHVIVAAGTVGRPLVPDIPNREVFKGTAIHSVEYHGGEIFTGKKVAVVGVGNTAMDISLDLYYKGASSITVVQRSPAVFSFLSTVRSNMTRIWQEGVPVEISDLKNAALPFPLAKSFIRETAKFAWDKERNMIRDLKRMGMEANLGEDETGSFPLFIHWRVNHEGIDNGTAELICDGKIKVKKGEISRFEEHSLVFSDASELETDVVVFGTGFYGIREELQKLLGKETINSTSELWGIDGEGELKGCYRPSGHPALWFAMGGIVNGRWGSKQLVSCYNFYEVDF